MTRAELFLSLALAVATAFGQGAHATQPPQNSAQVSSQSAGAAPVSETGNSSPKASATSSKDAGTQASQSEARPATSAETDGIQTANSAGGSRKELPQTSTILPLLGLIGLGSLIAGLFARR